MHHPKRQRKQKIVWDSNDFIACISTDEQLFANQAATATLTGMDKEEENEIDVRKAADAQAIHQLHEIKIPQVEFSEALQFKRSLQVRKKIKPVISSLTRYDVISNMYALDSEDKEYCKKEKISPFYFSWYFTNASRSMIDEFFTPSLLCSVGMDIKTFNNLEQHFSKKITVYKERYGYEMSDLVPNVARFRHVMNIPSSYNCFFPRPPKVATRRKSQMESKVIEATFQIRQQVICLHAQAGMMIAKEMEDLRFAQKLSEISPYKKEAKNDEDDKTDGEPPSKRYKEDVSQMEGLTPKVKSLALFLEELDMESEDSDSDDIPLVTDELLEMAKKQAAILKIRSLFPEQRPKEEQLERAQKRINAKNNSKYLFTPKPLLSKFDEEEKICAADFVSYNEVDNDDYTLPAMPFFKKI